SPQLVEEIAPLWIRLVDEIDLPVALPALEARLALDGDRHTFVSFEPYQALHPVPLGERRRTAVPMLKEAIDEIVRHADVQRAERLACQHVDVTGPHGFPSCHGWPRTAHSSDRCPRAKRLHRSRTLA